MKKIGLIVNPVAGMGGSVGLKGTDDGMHREALALGAEPVTPQQTRVFLAALQKTGQIFFQAAPGKMGADYLEEAGLSYQITGKIDTETSAEDTLRIAREMVEHGIDLLVFVGGDGTARDIHDAIATRVPVVAVPSGVKVFSAVFAVSARGAAGIVDAFVEGTGFTEEEILEETIPWAVLDVKNTTDYLIINSIEDVRGIFLKGEPKVPPILWGGS